MWGCFIAVNVLDCRDHSSLLVRSLFWSMWISYRMPHVTMSIMRQDISSVTLIGRLQYDYERKYFAETDHLRQIHTHRTIKFSDEKCIEPCVKSHNLLCTSDQLSSIWAGSFPQPALSMAILYPLSGPTQWAMLQWLAGFVKSPLSLQLRNPLNHRSREIVTKLMTPFCWSLLSSPSLQCETYRDWLVSFEIRCTGDWRYCLTLPCAIFDGCCIFCQTRRSELELICLASYYSCSKFKRSGHGMTWHDMAWHGMTWHDIVTLDESWFDLSIDHELIWLPAGASVFDRERHMIQSLKLMPTAVWNPHGFHLVDALSKGMKFSGSCYVTRILELLYE
jgi:hypothetical protein